jgi:group I intron endonuclease
MIIYSIYKLTNTQTSKSYIGFTKDIQTRLNNHCAKSKTKRNKLYNAVRKYGWNSFTSEIIYQSLDGKYCQNIMESYFIKEYDTFNNGYNSTLGGEGSSGQVTVSQRKKMSKSRGKRFAAKDSHGNIFQIENTDERFLSGELVGVNKNIKFSDETKRNMSISRLGNKNRLGKQHSDETKKIISERTSQSLKGKPRNRICRLQDHKEMAVATYTKWLNRTFS